MSATGDAFGTRLRRYREVAGLSQEALAERAGLSANAISSLERGERKRPYPDTLRRLADALGLDERERATLAASLARDSTSGSLGPMASARPAHRIAPFPGEPTPLIGREREVEVVQHLLLHATGRPLTLTGPGGVGKTRLALRVAREVSSHFADGSTWVDLGGLSDATQVIPAISRSLGLEGTLSENAAEAVKNFLADREFLLVLDNFEHLLGAAGDLVPVLATSPDLRMLVTSRSPLNIRGEQEYVVPPLELPISTRPGVTADISGVPSVQLFTWHVRQRDARFDLARENQADVSAICRRLDGVPLALELAAARVKVLGIGELLHRLDHVLPVLTGGPRDLPARQQTMEGAIKWSYDLLPPAAQSLFRRLSIFAGGWTLDSAERVIGPDPDLNILEGMASLLDQSLIRKDEQGLHHRFFMLETLREYGLGRLEESGELETVQTAHLAWCVALAEEADQRLGGPEQAVWLARLEAEHDNLRTALGSPAEASGEARLRLAGSLWRFWWWHGHLTEGRTWLEQLLQLPGDDTSPWRGNALTAAGILAREQGDFAYATAVLEEALSIRRHIGDIRGAAQALNILGLVAMNGGNLEHAARLYEESIQLYREMNYPLGIANALNNLASSIRDVGEFARAITLYEESVAIYQRLGEKRGFALTLHNIGRARRDLGELDEAERLLNQALVVEQELGDRLNVAMTHHNLGRVAGDRGDVARAATLYRRSLDVRVEFGDKLGCIKVVEDVAALAAGENPELAVRLQAASAALRTALGAPVPPADRDHIRMIETEARIRLSPAVFDDAARVGRDMDAGQAVEEALDFLHRIESATGTADPPQEQESPVR